MFSGAEVETADERGKRARRVAARTGSRARTTIRACRGASGGARRRHAAMRRAGSSAVAAARRAPTGPCCAGGRRRARAQAAGRRGVDRSPRRPPALSAVEGKARDAADARSTKSWTASDVAIASGDRASTSGSPSGPSCQVRSPARRERLAARGQHRDARARGPNAVHERCERLDEVLTVVEHDQHVTVTEEVDERGIEGQVLALLDVERAGDGLYRGAARPASRQARRCTVPEYRRSADIATSRSARRVFPTPPGPTSVTRRSVSRSRRTASTSSSRPTNRVASPAGWSARRVPRSLVPASPDRPSPTNSVGSSARIRRFELARRRREIEPQLVAEEDPELVRLPERLGLATGAIQRHHELTPETLTQRMVDDEAFELTHDGTRLPERQSRFEQVFDRDQPKFFESHRVASRPVEIGELVERRASPQPSALPSSSTTSAAVSPRCSPRTRPANRAASMRVGRSLQEVAGCPGKDVDLGRERLAQPGDIALDGGDRRRGRAVAPQRVGEPVDRHHRRAVREQDRERHPGLRPADRDHGPGPPDLERPENPHEQFHASSIVPVLASHCKSACKRNASRLPRTRKGVGARWLSPAEQQRRTACRWCR